MLWAIPRLDTIWYYPRAASRLRSGYLLASEALENPPPPVEVTDPLPDRGGGGFRAIPLYRIRPTASNIIW